MPIETIPGTQLRYYMVSLDDDGNERNDDGDGRMSERVTQALKIEKPTDVFVFVHGWKGDLDSARSQYGAWMKTLVEREDDLAQASAKRSGFVPLLVGLHWPSLPFGNESFGGAASFGPRSIDDEIDAAAASIADTPAAKAALRTIFEAAHSMVYAPATLPADVAEAYRTLDRESGLSAEGDDPGADREPFDPMKAYALGQEEDAASFGSDMRNALLSPLVQLSFWKMKARAKHVGESGGFRLLSTLMRATADSDVRFHLMGHSFGCIVASATACGPANARLPRPVHSVVLVQGALSLWSCSSELPGDKSKAGYFRRLATGDVSGPIVTTRSQHDMAVGTLYPIAAGVARQVAMAPGDTLPKYGGVGTFGLRGGGLHIQDLTAGAVGTAYGFQPGSIYNVNCDHVIRAGGPPSGAHSDIARPEVGHLVWAAALGA